MIAVITHENALPLADPPSQPFFPSARFPLKDDQILHHGQHVAIVVAESREQAVAAARLVTVDYNVTDPVLGIENPGAVIVRNPWGIEFERGDVTAAVAAAEVVYDQTFRIAAETNSPMGLFATVARWEGDRLVVHESTQWPMMVRRTLATMFGLAEEHIRVLAPYIGGGFGAGLRAWPHLMLTALAARVVGRPVKLVLTRPQMFNSVGHRPQTLQRLWLGATRAGRLVAIDHEGISTRGIADDNAEPITLATGAAYSCPNVATHDTQVLLNIPAPCAMRAPGAAEGNFAIESALDELSYQLQIDPIELRLLNYAEVHPQSGLPWSSKALRECFLAGAERFGWAKRDPRVGSMRNGHQQQRPDRRCDLPQHWQRRCRLQQRRLDRPGRVSGCCWNQGDRDQSRRPDRWHCGLPTGELRAAHSGQARAVHREQWRAGRSQYAHSHQHRLHTHRCFGNQRLRPDRLRRDQQQRLHARRAADTEIEWRRAGSGDWDAGFHEVPIRPCCVLVSRAGRPFPKSRLRN